MSSKNIIFGSYILILLVSFFYYPKWNKAGTEATISWDVSGYYWYLPAMFIYNDVKQQAFGEEIIEKYGPSPDFQQSFPNHSGNRIMKYSAGMALQYLPFFTAAHVVAEPLGFEADGFSRPYQVAIQLGGLIMCFIGLWYLRKVLLLYFKDATVSIVLVIYVLATNYFNYGAIDSALPHNWLFTWYALLIYNSHHFYKTPSYKRAFAIGSIVGILALTRPTEIIAVIIPLLWGINAISLSAITERLKFYLLHWKKLALAISVCGLIGFIQLAYWKYAGGEWIIYSYSDQGFSWLSPHFKDYLFSYRSGWLRYTPIMMLSIIGLSALIQRRISSVAILLFVAINIYIVCAWDIWWYGGRAMIQSYPILAFPLAALCAQLLKSEYRKYLLYAIIGFAIYYNIWWTHQSHRGNLIDPFSMTKEYYWKVAGRYDVHPEVKKLIDTDEWYPYRRKNVETIYASDYAQDTIVVKLGKELDGFLADYIGPSRPFGHKHSFQIPQSSKLWLRVKGDFKCEAQDFTYWRMPQMVVIFMDGSNEVKRKFIRLHRFLDAGKIEDIHIDTKIPDVDFDRVEVIFWNVESPTETVIGNIRAELFE